MHNTHYLFLTIFLFAASSSFAQSKELPAPAQAVDIPIAMKTTPELPFREIPAAPAEYTACSVTARMIDGLGFRYYWATEGLRPEDLAYKASESGRTAAETLEHLHGLAEVVRNAVTGQPNMRSQEKEELDFATQRKHTLEMLFEARTLLLKSTDEDMANMQVVFQRGDDRSEFPFWNNLNGPLADALWHTGQIVMLRRASGNPFNSKVSVFSGKVRE